jgi:hypothetical protein
MARMRRGSCHLSDGASSPRKSTSARGFFFFSSPLNLSVPADSPLRGCFIESADVDFKKLALPLLPEDLLIPPQLVAISAINHALEDRGAAITRGNGARVAVLIGLETDMELYRHHARSAFRERINLAADAPRTEQQEKLLSYVSDAGTSTSYTSNIGNIIATRVASLWGFTGPASSIT